MCCSEPPKVRTAGHSALDTGSFTTTLLPLHACPDKHIGGNIESSLNDELDECCELRGEFASGLTNDPVPTHLGLHDLTVEHIQQGQQQLMCILLPGSPPTRLLGRQSSPDCAWAHCPRPALAVPGSTWFTPQATKGLAFKQLAAPHNTRVCMLMLNDSQVTNEAFHRIKQRRGLDAGAELLVALVQRVH